MAKSAEIIFFFLIYTEAQRQNALGFYNQMEYSQQLIWELYLKKTDLTFLNIK